MTDKKPAPTPLILKIFRLMFNTLGRLFPWYYGKLAYKLWLSPTKFDTPAREQLIADKANKEYVTVNQAKVRTWSWGSTGPTVLFIHGWSGRGTQISSMVQPLLDAGYQVVGIDLPAHGQSDGKQANPISISQALVEITNRIDNLHAVITHSFGGMVFGYFYNHYDFSPQKAVMICPPASLHTPINHFIQTLRLPNSVRKRLIRHIESFTDNVYDRLSVVKNLEQVKEPVLVIHDKQDDVVPFKDGQAVAQSAPLGQLLGTENLGHKKLLHDKEVIQTIIKFLGS